MFDLGSIDWGAVFVAMCDAAYEDAHKEDRLAGFVPLSKPTAPSEAPHPFPVQAMSSHWRWQHGA